MALKENILANMECDRHPQISRGRERRSIVRKFGSKEKHCGKLGSATDTRKFQARHALLA